MQALQYTRHGPPDVLQHVMLPRPEPGPGEVRVRMFAAGLAPVDTKLRSGMLQAHFQLVFPKIPGRDGTGVIEKQGPGVDAWAVGDLVCVVADQLGNGTCAEAILCRTDQIVLRPPSLTLHQAAALLQPGISAWTAVMETARVQPGMRVLVHGGAGAVGSLMVQLCRHLGADVSATCRHDNCDYVVGLGAARALAYDREGSLDTARGQDLVFDLIGAATHDRSYALLRPGGHLVYLTAAPIMDRGSDFGVQVTRAQIADSPRVLAAVAALATQGVFQPRVAAVFPLADARLAHEALENGHVTRGRLVLDIGSPT